MRAVVAIVLAGAIACGAERVESHERGLVIFGIDGMDWQLASDYMAAGRLPNLSALAERGGFFSLGTSTPPQSPVAWSDFITGTRSDAHGIYDFVHRDLATMLPVLSTTTARPPSWKISIGSWSFPLRGGDVELLRRGRPFWDDLSDGGVPSTIVKVPAHYPPEAETNVRVLAGMGTPDLLGTYGVFQLYTDDDAWRGKQLAGGRVHMIDFEGGQVARTAIDGPPNPFRPTGDAMSAPLEIAADKAHSVALVRLGGQERILVPGEWSDWMEVEFEPGMMMPAVSGMVRMRVISIAPRLLLYVSPINFDPTDPAQPISSPDDYAAELANELGRFGTLGIPEESKALESGVFSDADYLEHAAEILAERVRMMEFELARFRGGLLFVYFGTIDQVSHTFWRTLAPTLPPELQPLADVIPERYAELDAIVGDAIRTLPPGTDVIVMSDHGFSPWLVKANLNSWLREHGYLALSGGRSAGTLGDIDWTRTRAYSIGLNALYLNVAGREPDGIVTESERAQMLDDLESQLRQWRHPETGEAVVTHVERPKPTDLPERTPDLIVGYNRSYRASEASAIGGTDAALLAPNHGKWSGDHCMDPRQVPGVLFTSFDLARRQAGLVDLAPTILDYFHIPPSAHHEGKSLLEP